MTEEEFKKNAKTIPADIGNEEKEAIDYFKFKSTTTPGYENKEEKYANILLNLIEKLKKEKDEILNSKVGVDLSFDDYIPKDKIRNELKATQERAKRYYKKRGIFHNCGLCNNTCNWYKICVTYQELLEEE